MLPCHPGLRTSAGLLIIGPILWEASCRRRDGHRFSIRGFSVAVFAPRLTFSTANSLPRS
jgi:hypothetical protein